VKSDEIKARAERYNRIEKEADSLGRIIGIRRLKPSEEMRITGLTADLDGFNQALGENGDTIQVPKRAPYFVCAMVCEVDGFPFTMPKTRGELDAVYDRLDKEGIEAAMKAYIRLEGADKPEEEPSAETVIDEAKN
jgi:hypothetical protein